ncbi:MAG: DUF494 domain-containing protein [Polaromonas sp.]
MFEVLVYVYENYWQGAACPESDRLGRKLMAAGFDADEIQQALIWLEGLSVAARGTQLSAPDISSEPTAPSRSGGLQAQSSNSLRVYSVAEQTHLGPQSLGFVSFLDNAGMLAPHMREVVLDRAMAAPGDPVALDDLKIIVLMVFWSFGKEPDALLLDELCEDTEGRLAH